METAGSLRTAARSSGRGQVTASAGFRPQIAFCEHEVFVRPFVDLLPASSGPPLLETPSCGGR